MFHDIVCIVINTNVLNMNYVYSTLSHVCKLTNNLTEICLSLHNCFSESI